MKIIHNLATTVEFTVGDTEGAPVFLRQIFSNYNRQKTLRVTIYKKNKLSFMCLCNFECDRPLF